MIALLADRRIVSGLAALAFVAVLIGGAFAGLLGEAARDWSGAASAFDLYMLRVARFTLWQAVLSMLVSVLPAILIARALHRQAAFAGRGPVLALLAVPLAIPAIVAALALLALLGRAGILAVPLGWLTGARWGGIYGLPGILIAHGFFNMTLAARLLFEALETIPADQSRLAAQLGMGPCAAFRHVEWPALRAALPGVAALVFMLCVTSFTIVLMLGGGPRATTLEVAIYQSLRFDFDPARAVALTLVQIGLTLALVAVLARLGGAAVAETGLPVALRRPRLAGRAEGWLNGAVIAAAALAVLAPLAAIAHAGLSADLARLAGEATVHRAVLTSLVLALSSAVIAVALAWALAAARHASARKGRAGGWGERVFDRSASLVLVVPPIVIGAGWFVLLRHGGWAFTAAPVMVACVNAVMAMPFAARAIRPAHDSAAARHDRLCASLGLGGWTRLRLVDWPAMRRAFVTAFAFSMALSFGDLGVIALFGSESVQTLPYLLLSRMSAYRTADAAGLALLLALVCLALMFAAERLGRAGR